MKHPVRSFIGHAPADEVVLLGVKKVVLGGCHWNADF